MAVAAAAAALEEEEEEEEVVLVRHSQRVYNCGQAIHVGREDAQARGCWCTAGSPAPVGAPAQEAVTTAAGYTDSAYCAGVDVDAVAVARAVAVTGVACWDRPKRTLAVRDPLSCPCDAVVEVVEERLPILDLGLAVWTSERLG